ncbi:hypothetical protein ACHWQZ_G002557 [Mnemiopsis leidyi]
MVLLLAEILLSISPTDTSSLLPRATLTPIRDQTLSDPPSTPGTDSSSILDVSVLDSTISTDTSKTVKEVIVDEDKEISENRFNGVKMSHKNIWTQLAKELHETLLKDGKSTTPNWQSCRDKFKNLRNKYNYKEIKKKQDQSGSAAEAVDKFLGWAEMDVFFCQNPSIKPEFTASSIKPKLHDTDKLPGQVDKENTKMTVDQSSPAVIPPDRSI